MPSVVYTLGDPGGTGPELLFLGDLSTVLKEKSILVIGPESILEYYCRLYQRPRFWQRIDNPALIHECPGNIYLIQPPGLEGLEYEPGRGDKAGGFAAGSSLETACDMLKNGHGRALVTGPLNKAFMLEAGFRFGGHTEFLADYFKVGPDRVCMHLCGDRLRVSLVTTHPPLRLVPDLITREKILICLKLTWEFVQKLGLTAPIAVCGLNPHAGEQGRTGTEELEIINPAIREARGLGVNVQGAFPADTVFSRAWRGEFSAVLAMYHDQGLGPLKLVEFGKCVNITLGLPVIRTSVDHGTGYDLAGTGKASPLSLEKAMGLALKLMP